MILPLALFGFYLGVVGDVFLFTRWAKKHQLEVGVAIYNSTNGGEISL